MRKSDRRNRGNWFPQNTKKISIHRINLFGKLRVESFKLVTSILVTIPTDCQQLFFQMRLGSRKVIQKKRGLECSLTSQLYEKKIASFYQFPK